MTFLFYRVRFNSAGVHVAPDIVTEIPPGDDRLISLATAISPVMTVPRIGGRNLR